MNLSHFEAWGKTVGVSWRAIKPHIDDVMGVARTQWPEYLQNAPMNEEYKVALRKHWQRLHKDFAIRIQ
jgi:serine/threonine-protein kinase HipA